MIKAKSVLKNKFWIIEDNGVKIGTLNRNDEDKKYYNEFILSDGKSKFYHGISNAVDTVTNVYNNEQEVDFLFIDGNHTYEQVLADFLMYSPAL